MSDTVLFFKKNLSKYQIAYLKCCLLVSTLVFPYLVGEFKGYQQLSDIKPINWVVMFLQICSLTATTVYAFISKGHQTNDKQMNENEKSNSKSPVTS